MTQELSKSVETRTLDAKNKSGSGSRGGGGSFVDDMYENWFLDYASYVILDRAIPNMQDGLKPVQRRILHAMNELEDGRFNKAANIIGHTMRYHPHGDMAIEDALVKIAQKELLIDMQGNWGNIATGDPAAAPRYIEARLSEFAKEVLFKDKVTEWLPSYDGRNQEPVHLPVKFPLLLATGVEGIAVGLSTKVLPHSFNELLDQSIAHLRGKDVEIFPDFPSGGAVDVSQYNDGKKGSRLKVRAKIEIIDNKTLAIREIPYGVTTTSVIDSILSANDKGKLRIKKVEDNTASEVEILVHLPSGVSPLTMVDALYAFSDCEVSISPSCCVVKDEVPVFCGVKDLLIESVERTKSLLEKELSYEKQTLEEKLHMATLEIIFIENKIYRKIENLETWEKVLSVINKQLNACVDELYRPITDDDVVKLTEIKIKRITKFDRDKAEESLTKLEEQLSEVELKLANLVKTTIEHYKHLKKKYGKGRERKTIIDSFQQVEAKAVAAATHKLYINRREGFLGTSLKKDELLMECTDLDEVLVFTRDGHFKVVKVSEKVFIGKNIIEARIFTRGDSETIYHVIYQEGRGGPIYAKRFPIPSVTRDRDYDLTKGSKGSRILYLSANLPDGHEMVEVILNAGKRSRNSSIDVNFDELPIQTRGVRGQLITKEAVQKVVLLQRTELEEVSEDYWFDKNSRRLNKDGKGQKLGSLLATDIIFALYKNGSIELYHPSLDIYFDDNVLHVGKYNEDLIVSVVYFLGSKEDYYVKRFRLDELAPGKREEFIGGDDGNKLLILSFNPEPLVEVSFKKGKQGTHEKESIYLSDIVAPKGVRAIGNKLSRQPVSKVKLLRS